MTRRPPKRIERLVRAGLALQHHPDPDVREVGLLISDWWWSGGATPLDSALGLRSHGGVGTQRSIILARRDHLLCRLYHQSPDWSALTPTAAAGLMSLSAVRYETGQWKRDAQSMNLPSSEPQKTWWRILSAGERIPGAKRLAQILGSEIQDPV